MEAAEREARESREAAERVAARADDLSARVDELAAGVAEAVAALREEIRTVREPEAAAPVAAAEAVGERKPDAEEEPPAEEALVPEGARLLALKMALDGRPREETAAYLRENFELADPGALLDEVYAQAAG